MEAGRIRELIVVFGTLGFIGFGGPAAHLALMRREVVERRGWLTDAQLVDLIGITNLIPGPNSTEMAMHVGRLRAGGRGLVVAGLAFILPAAAIVLALAWAYVAFGETPAGEALLYGIKPVVIAIVAVGGWRIIRTLGMRITGLDSAQGFAAETSAATVLQLASQVGIPVSTTHTITSAIVGVGAVSNWRSIRWVLVIEIVSSWMLTLPATILLGVVYAILLRGVLG